jgi:hypothetical protein
MSKFRKKPVVIEARQYPVYPGEHITDAEYDEYVAEIGRLADWANAYFDGGTYDIVIETLEGEMHAVEGDFIIRGVQGEFYPCKPGIFEATYDSVGADVQREREALKAALTDGYWRRTGYRTSWEHIGPLMDAIFEAGFRLVSEVTR